MAEGRGSTSRFATNLPKWKGDADMYLNMLGAALGPKPEQPPMLEEMQKALAALLQNDPFKQVGAFTPQAQGMPLSNASLLWNEDVHTARHPTILNPTMDLLPGGKVSYYPLRRGKYADLEGLK